MQFIGLSSNVSFKSNVYIIISVKFNLLVVTVRVLLIPNIPRGLIKVTLSVCARVDYILLTRYNIISLLFQIGSMWSHP